MQVELGSFLCNLDSWSRVFAQLGGEGQSKYQLDPASQSHLGLRCVCAGIQLGPNMLLRPHVDGTVHLLISLHWEAYTSKESYFVLCYHTSIFDVLQI